MSTVMYAYRVYKNVFWDFIDKVRKVYEKDHVLYNLELKEQPKTDEERIQAYNSVCEMHRKLKEFGAEIQVFDYDSDSYVFLVRERNYFFLNARNEHDDWPLENYWYDTRADLIVLNQDEILEVAEWIDAQIISQHFFLVPLTDATILDMFYQKKYLHRENNDIQ